MLKALINKQLTEIFRNFFFDQKKNRARSKAASIGMIIGLFILLYAVVGGMFGFYAYNLVPIASAGFGWLYYLIFGGVGLFFGVFGSVFNTYSGLYLAKDNDLLLSMPIPPIKIVTARTFSVFVMGLMYSSMITLPVTVINYIFVPQTVLSVIGSIAMILSVALLVFVLSCLLGWVIAKIAVKLKGRGYITVIISLVFVVLYYILYFKAADIVQGIITNAALYGESIKGNAYPFYLFGSMGEGNVLAIAIFFGAALVLAALAMYVLSRTFIKVATSLKSEPTASGKSKNIAQKSIFSTLLSKEYTRFKTCSTYMLNCSLGTLLLPALGVFILVKTDLVKTLVSSIFTALPGAEIVMFCLLICFIAATNAVTAPSVSLEGKTLWMMRSLPIDSREPLLAKLTLHLILTVPSVLICSVCAAIAVKPGALGTVLIIVFPIVFTVMNAALGLIIGILKPNLNWTREIVPIKQSACIIIYLIASFATVAVPALIYFLALKGAVDATLFLFIVLALYTAVTVYELVWLMRRGAKKFAALCS